MPQIYYVGILAGRNDMSRRADRRGRAINRHDYIIGEIIGPPTDQSSRAWSSWSGYATRTGVRGRSRGRCRPRTIPFACNGTGHDGALILDVDFDDGTAVVTDHGRAAPLYSAVGDLSRANGRVIQIRGSLPTSENTSRYFAVVGAGGYARSRVRAAASPVASDASAA